MTLQAFYYKTWADGIQRHALVWGRMQDARPRPATDAVLPAQEAPIRIPYVYNGRLGWAEPQKMVLISCGDMQPPQQWVNMYQSMIPNDIGEAR